MTAKIQDVVSDSSQHARKAFDMMTGDPLLLTTTQSHILLSESEGIHEKNQDQKQKASRTHTQRTGTNTSVI